MSIEEKLKTIDWLKPVEILSQVGNWYEIESFDIKGLGFRTTEGHYYAISRTEDIRNTKSKIQKVKDMGFGFCLWKEHHSIPETEENAVLLLKLLGVEE